METISTLIEAGIAGVFAVFAILLFKEGAKAMRTTQEMFIKFLEAEREQRMKIMAQANDNLKDLTVAVQRISSTASDAKPKARTDKTQPRRDRDG